MNSRIKVFDFSFNMTVARARTLVLTTGLPAKSDSDVMFCLQRIRDLGSIDHLCINPIHRIGLILK